MLDINATSAFDATVLRDVENNIENRDSLTIILNTTFERIGDFLRDNDRTPTSIFVLTGGFIEGLYLATDIIAGGKADNSIESI